MYHVLAKFLTSSDFLQMQLGGVARALPASRYQASTLLDIKEIRLTIIRNSSDQKMNSPSNLGLL